MGINLTGEFNNNGRLLIDRSQGRLYGLPLFGCRNEVGIRLSKIRLHLAGLFPIGFKDYDIDFKDVVYDFRKQEGCCVVGLEVSFIDYDGTDGFDLIRSTKSVVIPLIKLPLLNENDVIMVNGLHKMVISQLAKQRDGQVDVGDDGGDITFNSIDFDPVKIKFGKGVCDLIVGRDRCGCFESMLAHGTKRNHLGKVIGNEIVIAYHKRDWYSLEETRGCVVRTEVRLT